MSKKILIIGQAPPLQKQLVPYDTTMLYDWFKEIGISKEKAQDLFDFEAMTDKPPLVVNGSHKPPTRSEMDDYFDRVLEDKIMNSRTVILLGRCPIDYFNLGGFYQILNNQGRYFVTLIHPSKRNTYLYNKNKDRILEILDKSINLKD